MRKQSYLTKHCHYYNSSASMEQTCKGDLAGFSGVVRVSFERQFRLFQSAPFGQSRIEPVRKTILSSSDLPRSFIGNSTVAQLSPILKEIYISGRSPSDGFRLFFPSTSCPPDPTSVTFSRKWTSTHRSSQNSTASLLYQNGFSFSQQDRPPPRWC